MAVWASSWVPPAPRHTLTARVHGAGSGVKVVMSGRMRRGSARGGADAARSGSGPASAGLSSCVRLLFRSFISFFGVCGVFAKESLASLGSFDTG